MSIVISKARSRSNEALTPAPVLTKRPDIVVRRSAPYEAEPGYSEASGLWFYGNIRLLHCSLATVPSACGAPYHLPGELDEIERQSEELVLSNKVLVCGIHNAAHMRAAVVPLRWGSPRIIVFSGGFHYHLGRQLNEEPFPAGRLWRDRWDARTDLAVSRRAPEKLPTYASHNVTVDRMVTLIAHQEWPGLFGPTDLLSPSIRNWGSL